MIPKMTPLAKDNPLTTTKLLTPGTVDRLNSLSRRNLPYPGQSR
jgi:hypothetical protein